MNEVSLELIAAKVKHLKDTEGCSTILFLGAGASATAGIPIAEEIIKHLESNDPWKQYIKCKSVTRGYTTYMDCLSSMERKRLLKVWIEKAKINAAHLYAAQLVHEGYVDCIVTTNFDPLIVKSLALYNIQPAIYDLAISKSIVTAGFDHPAVIYFHGQSHGFWQLNTEHELELPANVIKNAIDKISQTRAWIVVGYGGNDPIIDHLSSIDNFGYGLYWVGYEDNKPSQKVTDQLLDINTKEAYYLKGYEADSFFRALKNELKLSDPMITDKPFSHLLKSIENINRFKIKDEDFDPCEQTRIWIKRAIEIFENQEGCEETELSKEKITNETLLKRIKEIYNNDNFEELETIQKELDSSKDEETLKYYTNTLNSWGIALYELAIKKKGDEAENLFKDSIDKYRIATEIKKDHHQAFSNWGAALSKLARKKDGDEAENLFKESIDKYKIATEIKKDFHQAFNNWGATLYDLAKMKDGDEAENLFKESCDKYRVTTEIKKDYFEAFNNWGVTLYDLAKMKDGDEAENLFKESIDKYKIATEIKKDFHQAFNNWGATLSALSMNKDGDDAKKFHDEAIEKCNKAETIKKGAGAYNLACFYSLLKETEKSFTWFETALQFGTATREHIEKDTDLDFIRTDPRYIELLNKYRPVEPPR